MEWGGEYYDEDKAVTDIMKQQPKAMLIMVIILVAMFNGFKQPIIISQRYHWQHQVLCLLCLDSINHLALWR